jgi:hypothetical protein
MGVAGDKTGMLVGVDAGIELAVPPWEAGALPWSE